MITDRDVLIETKTAVVNPIDNFTVFNNGDRMLPRTNNDRKLVKIMSKKIVWYLTRAVVLYSLRRHLIILLCCV
jgi:hypothetical protein